MDDTAIANFCAVTGATAEQAEHYLEVSDGNVEAAILLYMETDGQAFGDGGANRASGGGVAAAAAPGFGDFGDDDIRRPIAAQHDTLVDGGDLYAGFGAQRRAPVHDPFRDSGNERLARLFAAPHELMFHGNLDQARAYARQHEKWVIVTIHDPTEFACQAMNRDLWKSPNVEEVVKGSFVFVQFDRHSPDAQLYENFYRVHAAPHIAIIDPRTGEKMKDWSNRTVSAEEFLMEAMDFLEQHSLDHHGPPPAGANSQVMERERTPVEYMTEEEQIAAAIAASVGETATAKKTEQKEVVVIDDDDDDEVKQALPAASTAATSPVASIEAKARPPLSPADQPTTIQFRFPDGSRVVQKFAKSDKVRVLFAHVKSVAFGSPNEGKLFELAFQRELLSKKLDESLDEAKVLGGAIIVDYE